MKHIQLIRPPMDEWYTVDQLKDNLSYPVGLCILEKAITQKIPDAQIEIIDGYNKPLEETIKQIGNADFVGATSIYANYDNALKVLEHAKNKGAKTIIGGANMTHLSKRTLTNRIFVDYAVINDGEEALPEIILGHAGKNTPNLVYRNGDKVLESDIKRNAQLTTLFDFANLKDKNSWMPKSIPISGIRGCLKAQNNNLCDFCSIDHKLKTMNPELVWEQVRILKGYGFDYFWEIGETAFPKYLNSMLNSRPADLSDTKWKFFICTDLVDAEVAKTLKALNTKEVQMGIETPNDNILQNVNKKARAYDINRAVNAITENGINIHAAIMYGLTGETPESANKTFEYIKSLVSVHPNIVKITTSHAIPFFGTGMFKRLAEHPQASKEYSGNLDSDDKFDYTALTNIYTKYFTTVDFNAAENYVQKTRELMDGRGYGTSIDLNIKSRE
jgi:radical SAM superfamily enzyme YgiQ (UPF0313 family)